MLALAWHFQRNYLFANYGPTYPDGKVSYYHMPILQLGRLRLSEEVGRRAGTHGPDFTTKEIPREES